MAVPEEAASARVVVRPASDAGTSAGSSAGDEGVMAVVPLAVMERRLILAALRQTNQDVPRAAARLEINPSTVYRKLQSWRANGLLPGG